MMPDRGLAALLNALVMPIGSHLDDKTLAIIVDAELAGEKIEQLYEEQLAHIEVCEQCAAEYTELFFAMEGIFGEMAETAESMNLVSQIWTQILSVTTEIIKSNFRLIFASPLPQIGETKAVYNVGDEKLLARRGIPGEATITFEVRATRLSPLTCRLAVFLRGKEDAGLSNIQINIKYGNVEKTTETNQSGAASFDNVPISDLVGLEITVENVGT